jgi:hypothetical protein
MLYSSLPQLRYCSAAPSSEGAFGGYHSYTHVLVNNPTREYRFFIENILEAAGSYKLTARDAPSLAFFYEM